MSGFVVFAAPRTGSYHLVSLLDSAPDLVCHGEIFKPRAKELRPRDRDGVADISLAERDADPAAYIRRVQALAPDMTVGFKAFPQHLNRAEGLEDILAGREWRRICLVRDPLEVYASRLRAQKTQEWTLKRSARNAGSRKSGSTSVTFTEESFEAFRKTYGNFLRMVARWRDTEGAFVIDYSELDETARRAELLSFIGSRADPAALTSEMLKQSRRDLSETFDNYAELSDYARAHPVTDYAALHAA